VKKKSKKRGNRPHSAYFVIWLSVIFLFIATAPYVYFHFKNMTKKAEAEKGLSVKQYPLPSPARETIDGRSTRRVAIIIDDIGYEPRPVADIIAMKAPITLSILPHCPYSREAAVQGHRAVKEILLHLPMEPHEYPDKNPGDGALLLSMSEPEIRRTVEENLKSVPYARGVNNHMGSRFMENEKQLARVFKQLFEKDLFFVDSYTTNRTRGPRLAQQLGMRFAGRDVFIDNNSDFTETLEILKGLMDEKNNWKTLIIIGHPYKSTIDALKVALPLFQAHGIAIVPLSELVS